MSYIQGNKTYSAYAVSGIEAKRIWTFCNNTTSDAYCCFLGGCPTSNPVPPIPPSKFVYSFNYTGRQPIQNIIANYIPLIATGALTYTYKFTNNNNLIRVVIDFTFNDDYTTNDGLSFINVSNFYNTYTKNLQILQFYNIPLSRGLNTGSQFKNLQYLNVSAVDKPTILSNTTMHSMFSNTKDVSGNLANWNTEYVKDMSRLFSYSVNFSASVLGWDTSSVIDMSEMLSFSNNFSSAINGWDTSSVKNMSGMCMGSVKFLSDISSWETYSVTDMSNMFYSATDFTTGLGNWNTGSVQNMANMFNNSTFNKAIGNWNTCNVTNMSSMFRYCVTFNQNISYNCPHDDCSSSDGSSSHGSLSSSESSEGSSSCDCSKCVSEGSSSCDCSKCVSESSSSCNCSKCVSESSSSCNCSKCVSESSSSCEEEDGEEKEHEDEEACQSECSSVSEYNYCISGWNTSEVTNMDNMFNGASNFNNGEIAGGTTAHMNWIVSQFNGVTPTNFSFGSSLTLAPTGNSPFSTV